MSPKKGSDRHKVTQQSEAEQGRILAQLLTSGQELSPTGRPLSLCREELLGNLPESPSKLQTPLPAHQNAPVGGHLPVLLLSGLQSPRL